MWDVHLRLGGFAGSGMQVSNCAKLSAHAILPCTAAFIGLHITSKARSKIMLGTKANRIFNLKATAYLEGTWVWTADHDLDDPNQGQIDVYTGRGIVNESANGPVWLIGTASEHAVIVQVIYGGRPACIGSKPAPSVCLRQRQKCLRRLDSDRDRVLPDLSEHLNS